MMSGGHLHHAQDGSAKVGKLTVNDVLARLRLAEAALRGV
jgi:hypothetical protein